MSLVSAAPLFTARNSRSSSYQIEQSLRFDRDANSYLSNTPSSEGNRQTYTISMWVKTSLIGNTNRLMGVFSTTGDYEEIQIDSGGNINWYHWGGSYSFRYITNAKLRDPSAWYHFVFVSDTTNVTANDRHKIYINGVDQTFSTRVNPSQNFQADWNRTKSNTLGTLLYNNSPGNTLDGYMAEVYHIDGTALEASDFGEYDNTGVWRPIEPSGLTYGTNGFYFNFSNSSNLGEDQAGSNDWTANSFTTSGDGTDVMSDTPTTNWATLNSVDSLGGNFFEGNLEFAGTYSSGSSQNGHGCRSTIRVPSGKWYVEASNTTYSGSGNSCMLGFTSSKQTFTASAFSTNLTPWIGVDASVYDNNVRFYWNGVSGGTTSGTTLYTSYAAGDTISFAIDFDAGKLWVGKNGSYPGDPSAGTNPTSTFTSGDGSWAFWAEYVASSNDANRSQANVNFGQREFDYPIGTSSATDYFNAVTYTGNGSTQSVTGVGFQPDLVWIKCSSTTTDHVLTDVVRGATKTIRTNSTNGEYTQSDALTSFDSDGFTLGDDNDGGVAGNFNINTRSYVAWCWKAGGAAQNNTDGTITAAVSANQAAGFSIGTFTGTGAVGSIGHGLGAAPKFILIKRTNVNGNSWAVYHDSLGAGKQILLNSTNAVSDDSNGFPSAPTSTVINVGTGAQMDTNQVGAHVFYAWSEVEGVSKFGSYTGNGSADGPSETLGFKPRFVMIKRTDSAENWLMFDSVRDTSNPTSDVLWANLSNAESANYTAQDFTATGFKIKTSSTSINASGGTYIYMAFAENFSVDDSFKAMNTKNLPLPDIKDGSDYFNTVLWTGTSAEHAITGVGFQPDWSWIKGRTNSTNHVLSDVVRGSTEVLESDSNAAAYTDAQSVKSFDADGVTLGTSNDVNNSTANYNSYVGWFWKAGGSGSSNTDGSITSTVSVNRAAGFSIVSYTGTGASATVGHGLGVTPAMVIVKNRDTATSNGWMVKHQSLSSNYNISLNQNSAEWNPSSNGYISNLSSSTTFGLTEGSSDADNVNKSGDAHIAYCFAEVEGYSKFSEYTGTNTTDNAFVYCGFAPAWLMVKSYGTGGTNYDWRIYDNTRNTYNPVDDHLEANQVSTENGDSRSNPIDFLSNGFKIRQSYAEVGSSTTYIFAAFAENPFGGRGVSPATAR